MAPVKSSGSRKSDRRFIRTRREAKNEIMVSENSVHGSDLTTYDGMEKLQ